MKKLLVFILLLIGINTKAQERHPLPNKLGIKKELRTNMPALNQSPLRSRIFIHHRSKVRNAVVCKKCIKQHRKHGINHRKSKRKNPNSYLRSWLR